MRYQAWRRWQGRAGAREIFPPKPTCVCLEWPFRCASVAHIGHCFRCLRGVVLRNLLSMAGWDEGRVFATRGNAASLGDGEHMSLEDPNAFDQYLGGGDSLTPNEIISRFSQFVRSFQQDNVFVYRYVHAVLDTRKASRRWCVCVSAVV
jgi:hypothetical protein